ncbi:DUF2752 domain-containing protein [Bacteroidota bacterium]
MWILGLTYLAFIDPYSHNHLDLCFFSLIGISFCPGCGLGRSISMIFHADLSGSLEIHPLGFFALIVILFRISTLLYRNFQNTHTLMEV